MSAKPERTRTPGVYKRGGRYQIVYRVEGVRKYESFRTLDEARRAKAARTTDLGRGEFEERSRVALRDYAEAWVERYLGKGRGGFREGTRDEYRRQLQQYVCPYFGAVKLTEVTPSRVASFVAWLCDEKAQGKRADDERRRAKAEKAGVPLASIEAEKEPKIALSDATVRNIMAPLRACLATAVREGLIRSNPARDVDLPHRPTADESEQDEARAMSGDELATLLALVPDRHRPMCRFLAATGLRISELIALQWRHLELDGSTPHVQIRRGLVKGRTGPPKSRHGRRSVPLDSEVVQALRTARRDSEWPGDDDYVFPATNGKALNPANLYRDALGPAREEADLAWVGFHTFRHTCASMLFADGRNIVQVQHWLGHHSAAFTLSVYGHLLDGDIGEPLALPSQREGAVSTAAPTPA
ncbi:MAG: tyrosine-type recombinase/integrase [Solirubrobacteraceae bacterium]